MAESQLVWSNNPGAFEQHLIRRYNNRLFPKSRRTVTQIEIDVAQDRDLKDYEKVGQDLTNIIEEIARFPDFVNSSKINELRECIDNLIEKCMGVGGNAYTTAHEVKELRRVIIKWWAKAVSSNPEIKHRLYEAEATYHQNIPRFEVPFITPMLRKDSPISDEEIVPALLTEKPETIASVIRFLAPDVRGSVQKTALVILKEAMQEGAEFTNIHEILRALEIKIE